DLAVGEELTGVFEEDDAVAQQRPALLGMRGDGVSCMQVRCVGRGARGAVLAHRCASDETWWAPLVGVGSDKILGRPTPFCNGPMTLLWTPPFGQVVGSAPGLF